MPTRQRRAGSSTVRRRAALISSFAVLTLSLVSTGNTAASAEGPFTINVVDDDGGGGSDVGMYASMVLNGNGYPVTAYYDSAFQDLRIATCTDPACTNPAVINTVSTDGAVGRFASLELNAAGIPVIAYYDETNTQLELAVCGDEFCSLPSTISLIDNAGDVGMFASLELDPSGFPVMSYFDQDLKDLKVAVCTDQACTTPPSPVVVDSTDDVGSYTSLALNVDLPVISYFDETGATLKVAVCGDTNCATTPVLKTLDTAGGLNSSSLVLNGALPVVGYTGPWGTWVAACSDDLCAGTSLVAVDIAPAAGASIAWNDSGTPVLSYHDPDPADLKVAICGDATCGTPAQPFVTLTTADSADQVGLYNSVALDSQGSPVVSYLDETAGRLKLASIAATSATVDVYAGATAASPPTPDLADEAGTAPAAADARLGWPTSMAFDAGGNMYFTDRFNHTVRRVAAGGGVVKTIAGQPGVRCAVTTDPCGDGGPADSANLRSPWGIALDNNVPQNIYISDYGDHRVRRIDGGTGVITTIAGTGTAGFNSDGILAVNADLNFPSGLTVDSAGAVLVADRANHRIRKIDTGGSISTFVGTGVPDGSQPSCSTLGTTTCNLFEPSDIKVRGSSDIPSALSVTDFFIAERGNNTVLVTRAGGDDGIIVDRIVGGGTTGFAPRADPVVLDQPVSLAYDALRQELYIADSHNMKILKYSLVNLATTTVAGDGSGKLGAGAYVDPVNGGTDALLTPINFPIGVAFLPTGDQTQGSVYFTAVYENQIRKLAITSGIPL